MKTLLHILTIWAFICTSLAHSGKGKQGGEDDDDNEPEQCGFHPPADTTTITTTTPPSSTSLAASCTFTGTQTYYSTSGCNGLTCESDFCIMDAAVTQPCGCDGLVVVTESITICPTRTPCVECETGWGIYTETQSCTSTSSPAASTSIS